MNTNLFVASMIERRDAIVAMNKALTEDAATMAEFFGISAEIGGRCEANVLAPLRKANLLRAKI